jgi:hypothetical protein
MPEGVVGPTYGLELNGTLRALRLMLNVFSMMGSPINMVGRPEVGSDAATKAYVDGTLYYRLKFLYPDSIDLQGGRINFLDDPTQPHHPTSKRYVDKFTNELKTLLRFVPYDIEMDVPASMNISAKWVSGLESIYQEQLLMKEKLDGIQVQIAETKTTNDTLKSIIRNFTPTAMKDPFVFCGNHITFLSRNG